MADREIIHTHDSGGGNGGMGAILGMVLGVLLVGGLIFFFAGNWERGGGSDTKVTINPPSAPATTGSAPSAPRAPSNPAR